MKELLELYRRLPDVPCQGCGECCVSPTSTVIEFVEAMDFLLKSRSRDEAEAILLKPPETHPAYEGNLTCRFQEKEKCAVHPARTLACRLFGLPVISRLHIENMENCRKIDFSQCGRADDSDLRTWLSELTRLNGEVAPYYCEPYWISGLNVECWLAVYFDPFLDNGAFGELQRFLRGSLDLSFLEGRFRDATLLKEKVDLITVMYQLVQGNDRQGSLSLIQEIRSGFPLTGTYYLAELEKIEALLRF